MKIPIFKHKQSPKINTSVTNIHLQKNEIYDTISQLNIQKNRGF